MKRAWLLALLLPWPSALAVISERASVWAEQMGQGLGALQRVAPAPAVAAPVIADPAVLMFEQLPGDSAVFEGQAPRESKLATKAKAKSSKAKPAAVQAEVAAPKFGIRVPAGTVLRLANARAVPQGSYVPAEAGRPAGMRLQGVSGYGVGLRDGDVLTHVAGAPATSRSSVVNAVLQARAVRAAAISATFWREGEPWRLLVEMPYLKGG